jgi:hypothetical protein
MGSRSPARSETSMRGRTDAYSRFLSRLCSSPTTGTVSRAGSRRSRTHKGSLAIRRAGRGLPCRMEGDVSAGPADDRGGSSSAASFGRITAWMSRSDGERHERVPTKPSTTWARRGALPRASTGTRRHEAAPEARAGARLTTRSSSCSDEPTQRSRPTRRAAHARARSTTSATCKARTLLLCSPPLCPDVEATWRSRGWCSSTVPGSRRAGPSIREMTAEGRSNYPQALPRPDGRAHVSRTVTALRERG